MHSSVKLLVVFAASSDGLILRSMALRRPVFDLASWTRFWRRPVAESDPNAALFEDWKGKLAQAEPDRISRTRFASVSDVMATKLVTLSPDMALHRASCLLREHSVSGAPVVENGAVVGMLSQTDMLYKAAGKTGVPLGE